MDKNQPIVFAGTPEFAATILQQLIEAEYTIVGVYTQPDKASGRGQKVTKSPVKQLAESHQLPIFQPATLKDENTLQTFATLKPHLLIVAAYGLLLPTTFLEQPTLGAVNVHASLLPRWRGAAPIQRAILAGDNVTGVNLMQMDEGLDTGDILATAQCLIAETDTASDLHDKLALIGAELLVHALPQLSKLQQKATPQSTDGVSYASKINKADAQINWNNPSQAIHRQIRAFTPWPGAFSFLGEQRIKILEAKMLQKSSTKQTPGTITTVTADGIDVATHDGLIRLARMQLPGKKAMDAQDIACGYSQLFSIGNCFSHIENV